MCMCKCECVIREQEGLPRWEIRELGISEAGRRHEDEAHGEEEFGFLTKIGIKPVVTQP